MKKLFTFITKKESSYILTIAAKVYKVLYIASACLAALFVLIIGIVNIDYSEGFSILIAILLAPIVFFITLFVGLFVESLILGFSIMTKNQYEELVLKNKVEEEETKKKSGFDGTYDKLNQLGELKKLGIITDDEYEEKKKELLKLL